MRSSTEGGIGEYARHFGERADRALCCKFSGTPDVPEASRDGPACRTRGGISGGVPEWPKGTDCKSVVIRLRRFKSSPLHQTRAMTEGAPFRRCDMAVGDSATVRGLRRWAGIAQRLEHQPSKLRVASSNLVSRSNPASPQSPLPYLLFAPEDFGERRT